jgi:hypothetical protein
MKKLYFAELFGVVALLGLNSALWHNLGLGLIFLILYFWVVSKPAARWLGRFFTFSPNIPKCLLGAWCAFVLVSVLTGVLVVVGLFSLASSLLALVVGGAVLFLLDAVFTGRQPEPEIVPCEVDTFLSSSMSTLVLLVYGALVVTCFALLFSSRSSVGLTTPWQTIHPAFIYFFAAATALLGLLIFSPLKGRLVVFLFVVHSLLIHSYLPLTHTLLYGADGWRHLATEERLVAGLGVVVPRISDSATAPTQKIDLGLVSYSQLWGSSSLLAHLTDGSLLTINRLFFPFLFALLVPLFLYEIAQTLGWKRCISFGVLLLSFLPFALTSTGSFSLPVSFGFVVWLSFVVLLVKRLMSPERKQLVPLALVFVGLGGGYALYAVLGAVAWVTAEVFLFVQKKNIRPVYLVAVVLALAEASLLPLLEVLARYSSPLPLAAWPAAIKQLAGNFMAFYLAAGPRPHDIATGNIIFNQVPLASFVPNLFTWNRWWLVGFMLVWWTLAVYGLVLLLKKRNTISLWFVTGSVGTFGAYILGRYFFQGEQVLTRRLEPVLALSAIFLVTIALHSLAKWWTVRYSKKWFILGVGFVLTAAVAASFTLGPDTQTVSVDEYRAMQAVSHQSEGKAPCVIAGTYPLLALEAVSHKQIVGGGFPITHAFEQSELQKIFGSLSEDPNNESSWQLALLATGAKTCYLVAPFSADKVTDFFGAAFGNVGVWQYP